MFNEQFETFQMFGLSHIIFLLLFIGMLVLLYGKRDFLKGKPKLDHKIRWGIAIYLLLMEWIYYGFAISNWSYYDLSLLPLGLCAMSLYFLVVVLFLDSEKLFKILYPWAITSGLLSLIVADQTFEFPHFRFIHFFGNHGLFIIMMCYLIWVKGFKITHKDILRSSGILLIITSFVFVLNFIIDTNHLFLRELPDGVSDLLYWMGYPIWVFVFMGLIFILFNLWYLPFYFNKKTPEGA